MNWHQFTQRHPKAGSAGIIKYRLEYAKTNITLEEEVALQMVEGAIYRCQNLLQQIQGGDR